MTEDTAPQEALFYIEGPDERGCVWAHGANSRQPWTQNLGPADKVAELMATWLNSLVEERREPAETMGFDLDEVKKQLAKHLRKAARPEDHREEGGEG